MTLTIPTIRLTGTLLDATGHPVRQYVTLTPSFSVLRDVSDLSTIVPSRVQVLPDNAGHFAVDLLATNYPGVDPANWAWRMVIPGGPTYNIPLDYQTPGGTLDLIDILSASASATGQTVVWDRRIVDSIDYDKTVAPTDGQAIVWNAGVGKFKPGLSVTSLDIRNFGAVCDGTTDDRAAVQACVDAAVAQIAATGRGATVYLPPGVIYFGTGSTIAATATDSSFSNCGVKLPVGLAATLTIKGAGRGVTTIKLSSSCRNAFVINKTADYQTFQNVTTEDFDVDNDSTVGRCHVLIGNIPASITRQVRLNYANLTHRRHTIRNVPVDATGATTTKFGIGYIGQHVNAGQDGTIGTQLTMEATQTSTLNVVVEDVDQYGGDGLANVTSWLRTASYQGAGPTNHFYDQIHFRRCRHFVASVPAATLGQTSFYMCGSGLGEHGTIIDCYSENIGDDAIELGAMQNVTIDRFRCLNPFLIGILIRVSQPPRDVNSQRIVIRDFHSRLTSALCSGTTGPAGAPLRFLLDNTATMGTVVVENAAFESVGQTFTVNTRTRLFVELNTAVQRLVVDGLKATLSNYTFDGGSATELSLISIVPNTNDFSVVELSCIDVRVTGLTQTGAGGLQFHVVQVDGSRPRVSIDGLDTDLSGVTPNGSGTSTSQLTVAKNTAGTIRIIARGIRPRASAASGGRNGLRLYSTGTVEQLVIEDSNFSSGTGLSTDIDLASASTNAAALQLRGNTYLATSTATAITPSGSPFAYRNLTGRQQQIRVSGGTVTVIEWGDTAATYTTTGLTSGMFTLASGQYLRVTYSSAPTMTAFPLT